LLEGIIIYFLTLLPSAPCPLPFFGEYIQFLHIALGSLRELDTQLIIAKEVTLADIQLINPVLEEADKLQGILVSTLQRLKN
jgi:four helix bundle protein